MVAALSGIATPVVLRIRERRLPDDAVGQALATLERSPSAPQSQQVALGGFEAMTDPALRTAIRGEAGSGAWPPRRRNHAHPIDRLAADIVGPAQAD